MDRRYARSARSKADGRGRRRFCRARLDHQRQSRLAGNPLSRRGRVRHRRRRHLRHLRRQCREMVSRPPRSRRRPDRSRIRRRRGRHRNSDPDDDCLDRICRHLPLVRAGSGHHYFRAGMVAPSPACRRGSQRIRGQGPAIEEFEHAGPDARVAGVLAALCDVRAGVRQRLDGHRADRLDRQGLRRRIDRDRVRRLYADRGRHHRQPCQWRRTAVLRMGIGSDRARIRHGVFAPDLIRYLANGGGRPVFGWVSDQIGREYTMAIAFTAGGAAYWLLGTAGTTPWTFVICAALIFFTWGEIFSLFPSTCTDMFGPKYATTNTSLLYTAKGLSAFVVPLANLLKNYTGNWHAVFAVAAIMNFIVVAMALFVVRPMRISISESEHKSPVEQA